MYCVMRASVPSLYNVYRRYDNCHKLVYIAHAEYSEIKDVSNKSALPYPEGRTAKTSVITRSC